MADSEAQKGVIGSEMTEKRARYHDVFSGEQKVKQLVEAVEGLQWGSVTVKVKAGEIVVIEVTETRKMD